ncbi:MAG: hypothetical protein HWD85_03330 [Flavobacteriaceae bacterium]|nr:hypothetical protein [Flavobacteriaceae bacterium]
MCLKKGFSLHIFLFFFFLQSNIAQQKIDSVAYYLQKGKKTSQLVDYKKAVTIAQEVAVDSLVKKANVVFGTQSYIKKDTANITLASNNLLQLYNKSLDSTLLAKYYHFKALIHKLNYRKDSSFYYYHQSKNISLKIYDSLAVARRLLSMAIMQLEERDYLGGEITAFEGLKYIEPLKENKYTVSLYNTIGRALNQMNKNDEARKYYNYSNERNKKNPDKIRKGKDILAYLNNVGRTYYLEGKYEKAISYFTKGLRFDSVKIKYPYSYRFLLDNKSYCQAKLGNRELALEGYLEVLDGREKAGDIFGQAISHSVLSDFYKDVNKKKHHAIEGLKLARKAKANKRILECLLILSEVTNGQEAKKYFKEYVQLNNTILQRERTLKDQFAKVRYETDKKEKENLTLKIENEKKQIQLEKEQQQKVISFLVTLGSLLILGISVLVFKHRRKKLAFEAQLQKVEAREQERQQIAKSLHDEVAGDLRMLHHRLEKTNQQDIAQKIDLLKNNVRELSHQLSSVRFDEVSFKDQLINLVSDYFTPACKIKLNGINEINWKEIKSPIKRVLFLAVRESLQNAKKYASATQITVLFTKDKTNIMLKIQDNGIGFDATQIKKGIGLKNQQERVEELNGKFVVTSTKNVGTTIALKIPVHV